MRIKCITNKNSHEGKKRVNTSRMYINYTGRVSRNGNKISI